MKRDNENVPQYGYSRNAFASENEREIMAKRRMHMMREVPLQRLRVLAWIALLIASFAAVIYFFG